MADGTKNVLPETRVDPTQFLSEDLTELSMSYFINRSTSFLFTPNPYT